MRIAPYIEQANLYNSANLSGSGAGWPWWQFLPDGEVINGKRDTLFVCPSDYRSADELVWKGLDWDGVRPVAAAVTSYLAVHGTNQFHEKDYLAGGYTDPRLHGQDGVLYVNSRVTFGSILDGSSNTVMVGERPPSRDLEYGWQWAGFGDAPGGFGTADVCLGVHERLGGAPGGAGAGVTEFYRPGKPNDDVGNNLRLHFYSFHPAGANWALADGSVRFFPYSIDSSRNPTTNPAAFETILGMLATRSKGETFTIPD